MSKFYLAILILVPLPLSAETLCEESKDKHELSIQESDLGYAQAQNSVQYIDENFPKSIENSHRRLVERVLSGEKLSKTTLEHSSVLASPSYYAGYNNHVAIIQGTLLKQNALIFKFKYLSSGLEADKTSYEKALMEFCSFVSHASYVD